MSFDLDKNADLDRAQKITLGQHELFVAPLTLRKIKQAAKMQLMFGDSKTAEENIDRLVDFILLGLSRTYPALTADDLLDSEATVEQLTQAMTVIIAQGGGKKDVAAGEQTAASDPISPGIGSSPNSALN
jgi:hypothetical protein